MVLNNEEKIRHLHKPTRFPKFIVACSTNLCNEVKALEVVSIV